MQSRGWSEVNISSKAGTVAAMDWGGPGDPILFLHGGGANAAEWVPVVDHLVDDFRCVAFDFHGHGRTPAHEEPTFETYLAETDAVVDHLGIARDRLTLVGSSFGGAVAVCYEAQRPGCRAIVGDDSMPSAVHVGLRPNPDGIEHTAEEYDALGWGWSGDEAAYEARVAAWVAEDRAPEPYVRRCHQPGADGRYHQVPATPTIAAMHNLGLRPENPYVRVDNYADVRCPVLLLCATEGMASDNRPFVDSMPKRFPMVKVTWVEGQHGLNRQFPKLVAEHIRDFLSAVEVPTHR